MTQAASDSPGAAAKLLKSTAAGLLTLVNMILSSLTASTVIYSNASKQITSLANAAGYLKNDGAGALSYDTPASGGYLNPQDFRLSLATATPVHVADALAATVLYAVPYTGNSIGIAGTVLTSAEFSIKATDAQTGTTTNGNKIISGLTDTSQLIPGMLITGTNVGAASVIATVDSATQVTGTVNSTGSATNTITFKLPVSSVFDVFCFNNATAPKLEWCAWTNTTTRATALVYHATSRYLCKSGVETRRYLGTVGTDATAGQISKRMAGGVTAGAAANVGVWNYYNRRRERYTVFDSTDGWNYATAAWRSWDNNVFNRINVVVGVSEDPAMIRFLGSIASPDASWGIIGIGLDATNAFAADCITGRTRINTASTVAQISSFYDGYPGIGSHYLQLLEYGGTSVSFNGDEGNVAIRFGAHCDVWV